MKTILRLLVLVAAVTGVLLAQQAISAKAGMLNHVEGDVLLDGKAVALKFAQFPHIPENGVLTAREGRAEVLLGPGAILRVNENTEIALLSARLEATRIELRSGTALLDVMEKGDGSSITIVRGASAVEVNKAGVYRIDADPARLMVYDGEALVEQGGQLQKVKKSRLLALNGVGTPEKFDNKLGDPFLRWAKSRAEYLAMANVSSARYAWERKMRLTASDWMWNPYFGMFTYVPYRGVYRGYWGYNYWSPSQVYIVYAPQNTGGSNQGGGWQSAGGYRTVGPTSGGTSGVVAGTTAASAPSGSPAPATTPRASGGGSSRSR